MSPTTLSNFYLSLFYLKFPRALSLDPFIHTLHLFSGLIYAPPPYCSFQYISTSKTSRYISLLLITSFQAPHASLSYYMTYQYEWHTTSSNFRYQKLSLRYSPKPPSSNFANEINSTTTSPSIHARVLGVNLVTTRKLHQDQSTVWSSPSSWKVSRT